jgi:uncharacterized protein
MELHEARYPGRAPIDAYGNGGFRFAGMSHRGSLLLVPSGIFGWPVTCFEEVDMASLDRIAGEVAAIELLLLGCGPEIQLPSADVRKGLSDLGIAVEFMATGSAARTYNVLLAEERAVAAALIAVDNP